MKSLPFVDVVSLLLITTEAHCGEFGIDETRADLADTDRSVNELKTKGSGDGINGMLSSCIEDEYLEKYLVVFAKIVY